MRRIMKLKDYSFRQQIIGWHQPTYKAWMHVLKDQCGLKYTQLLQSVSTLLSNGLVQGSQCPNDPDVYIEDLPNIDLKLYKAIIRAIAEYADVSPMVVAQSLLMSVRRLQPERPFINKVGLVVYRFDTDGSILAVKLSANYTNRKYAFQLLETDNQSVKDQIRQLDNTVHEKLYAWIKSDTRIPLNTLMRFTEKTGWVKISSVVNYNTENYLKITE